MCRCHRSTDRRPMKEVFDQDAPPYSYQSGSEGPGSSLRFYRRLFGVKEYYRDENSNKVEGPAPHDLMAFERKPLVAAKRAGIDHFGFRLTSPRDIDKAGRAVRTQVEGFCVMANSRRAFLSFTSPIPTFTRLRFGLN